MSVRLYVGNLPKEAIEREKLQEIFGDFGENVTTKVIKDRKTGKCRGFAFVTVPTDETADALIEKCNGQSFMDSPLKIEKALPRSKEKPEKSNNEESQTSSNPSSSSPSPSPSKRGGGKKNRRNNNNSHKNDNNAIQPDPRWAAQLAELKERLATQASNS